LVAGAGNSGLAKTLTGEDFFKTSGITIASIAPVCGALVATPGVRMDARGFSVVETLVAATVVTTAIGALVQLSATAVRTTQTSQAVTMAVVLGRDKLEELRAHAALTASPPGSLDSDMAGYSDFYDAQGRPLAGAGTPPEATAYVRRWSVELLQAGPHDAVVLQVAVTSRVRPASTRLVTVKAQARP
jgi:Tfp pilus assembly protein PilV